ncbi:MAG TPA: AbrB/MazE/SpoVT family DNA-binding domain-containing protein [Bryobacteraceae bacterium]|jgi:AbrB family looped-hinge helix DNA binding protein
MSSKSPTPKREAIGRLGQRRQVVIPKELCEGLNLQGGDFVAFTRRSGGVLIKPRKVIDPDDVLTAAESALVRRAEREMRQGKYVTLAQLHHDLAGTRSRRSRKTA